MAVTIGEALVKLSGDNSDLSRSLNAGRAQLDQAARRAGESAGRSIADGTRRGLSGMVGGLVDTLGKVGLAAMGLQATGRAISGVFAGPIMAASDLSEAVNKVDVVFGKAAGSIHDFGKTAAQSMGMSRTEAEAYAGTFGNLLVSMGFGQKAAAGYSKSILTLASDMASFNNASPVEVLEAIRAGLVGETEPLRRYGVNLSAAAVEQEALARGIKTAYNEMSAQTKATLAYSIIMRQTKTAQGDFARTSTGMANSLRIIKASWSDIRVEIGNRLLPVLAPLVSGFAKALPSALNVVTPLLDAFGRVVTNTAKGIRTVYYAFKTMLDLLKGGRDFGDLKDAMQELFGLDISRFQRSFNALARTLAPFRQTLSGLFGILRGNTKGWQDFLTGLGKLINSRFAGEVGKFAVALQKMGGYLSNVAKSGYVFAEGFSDLPKYMRPAAQVLGSVVSLVKGLAKAFLDLAAGEVKVSEFFQRVATLVKQRGALILEAFGQIGKSIWDYLFAKDDQTGKSKAGALVTRAKGWLTDKARDEFGAAKALALDLWAWVFGKPNTGGDGQAEAQTFLEGHKGVIATAARLVFGVKGTLAINALSFLFGAGDLSAGREKVSKFLSDVRAWFTADNIQSAINAGGAIIKDVWAFLFGGEVDEQIDASGNTKAAWADGVVTRLVNALRDAIGRQTNNLNIGEWLFGKEEVSFDWRTESTDGVVVSLLKWIDGKLGELAQKMRDDPTLIQRAKDLGWSIANAIARAFGIEVEGEGSSQFFDMGKQVALSFIEGFTVGLAGGKKGESLFDVVRRSIAVMFMTGVDTPIYEGGYQAIVAAYGKEYADMIRREIESGWKPPDILTNSAGGPKVLQSPIGPGASPLAEQFADLFDPVALDTRGLGEKIGASISDGIASGLQAGSGVIYAAMSGLLDVRIMAAQVQTIDAVTLALGPRRGR